MQRISKPCRSAYHSAESSGVSQMSQIVIVGDAPAATTASCSVASIP